MTGLPALKAGVRSIRRRRSKGSFRGMVPVRGSTVTRYPPQLLSIVTGGGGESFGIVPDGGFAGLHPAAAAMTTAKRRSTAGGRPSSGLASSFFVRIITVIQGAPLWGADE